MQKITVKEIRGPLGRGEKKFFSVVDEKGAQYSTFDTKIQEVTPGSVLEVEVKVDGRYVNITEFHVIEAGATRDPNYVHAPGAPIADMARIRADFKITALTIAGKLAAVGKISCMDITKQADIYYSYLNSGHNKNRSSTGVSE